VKIHRIAISNHRAFWPTFEVSFDESVTVLMGRNNAGKSALLSSIARTVPHFPHRSPASIPRLNATNHATAEIEYHFSIANDEIAEALRSHNQAVTLAFDYMPSPNESAARAQLKWIAGSASQDYTATIQLSPQRSELVVPDRLATVPRPNQYTVARLQPNPAAEDGFDVGNFETLGWPPSIDHPALRMEMGMKAFDVGFRRIFRFLPERRPQPMMTIQKGTDLAGDASNLVSVLDTLRQQRARFDYYEDCVRRLIPEIGEIRLETEEPGQKSIRIAFSESKSRRDLTFGLDELGTGTVQALALVYAIAMSDHPRVILIDEPSNFLHPGAARELLRLAARHSEHQYIIASHSPLVLEQFPTAAVVLLERGATGSVTARNMNSAEANDQKVLLRELGLSAPDVFGADRIVWVEGPTERDVYTSVTQQLQAVPRGTVFLPLVSTGDLEGRAQKLAVEIYRRMSAGIGLAPSRVAFLLDREDRDASAIKELETLLGNMAFFSPGRMLENSFLDESLVAGFLSQTSEVWNGLQIPVERDTVAALWNECLDAKKYLVSFKRASEPQRWRDEVHAARILTDTVQELTAGRFQYRKVEHGLQLIQLAKKMSVTDVIQRLQGVALAAAGPL